MKKILLSLVAIMLAIVARAAEGDTFTFEGLNYKVITENPRTAMVALNWYQSGEIVIPYFATGNGSRYIVTKIDDSAFHFGWGLTSVTIPSSVTSIGKGAFSYCDKLEEIIVDAGNKDYCSDNGALYNIAKTRLIQCPGAKTEFDFPSSVTSIWKQAFAGCSNLTSVTIPNSVNKIDTGTFAGCRSLTSDTITTTVTEIREKNLEM